MARSIGRRDPVLGGRLRGQPVQSTRWLRVLHEQPALAKQVPSSSTSSDRDLVAKTHAQEIAIARIRQSNPDRDFHSRSIGYMPTEYWCDVVPRVGPGRFRGAAHAPVGFYARGEIFQTDMTRRAASETGEGSGQTDAVSEFESFI